MVRFVHWKQSIGHWLYNMGACIVYSVDIFTCTQSNLGRNEDKGIFYCDSIADFWFIVFLWARFHLVLMWQLLSVSAQTFMYPRRTSFKSIRLRRTDWFCILDVFKESDLLKVQISCWIHAVHFSTVRL